MRPFLILPATLVLALAGCGSGDPELSTTPVTGGGSSSSGAAAAGIDLAITAADTSIDVAHAGDTAPVAITISRSAEAATSAGTISVSTECGLSHYDLGSTSVAFAAGETSKSVTVNVATFDGMTSTWPAILRVDKAGQVTESNEGNNSVTITFRVSPGGNG